VPEGRKASPQGCRKYQAAVDCHHQVKVLIGSGEGHLTVTAKATPKTEQIAASLKIIQEGAGHKTISMAA